MKINNVLVKANRFLWLDYVAVAIIIIAFFIISYCGFFFSDDLTMAYGGGANGERVMEISSIWDVCRLTWWWYFHLGGRLFSVAAQYFFCGFLGNKVWFDIVNTMFFVLLIAICGSLVRNEKKGHICYVLLFALSFWLLCPKPDETLFWLAGSTTHLWGNTLAFVLLWLFLKYKDANFSVVGKVGLFFLSIFTAAEFIPCVSICGAFVVYYVLHIKRFKGNAVPIVVGFAIGSMFLLFAPGNFIRASISGGDTTVFDSIRGLMNHPIWEIKKYKTLWIFLIVLFLGWIKNKVVVKTWMRKNAILLLSLGWSVIAFSVVFRPNNRALFFPETLSLVLFLKFFYDNYQIFVIQNFKNMRDAVSVIKRAILMLLFVVFIVDSVFAVIETKNQSRNNDILMEDLANSGGIVALDRMISSHRMAYAAHIDYWTWESLADRFGLDSVRVYPFYCLGKYYSQAPPFENIYVDDVGIGEYAQVIVRIENEELQEPKNHIIFTIDYIRPQKWYKRWLDKWRNYQYDRTVNVEREKPDVWYGSAYDVCFEDYCYFVIFLSRENAKHLKSIKYEIE